MSGRARSAIACVAAVLAAAPAHAHGDAKLGDFYEGLFQPFFHPEFLLAALALALWSAQQEARAALALGAGFAAAVAAGALAALAGVAFAASTWAPRVAAIAFGAAVAARVRVGFAVALALGAACGLAHGHAATAAERAALGRPALWTIGLALGAGLLAAYANAAAQRFPTFWMQVAMRVAGSWIAAIALLAAVVASRSA